MYVNTGASLVAPADTARLTRERWGAHSGHRMPTGVGVMQSGQIGRPQLEHDTLVGRA
jgi:hypothetical protein